MPRTGGCARGEARRLRAERQTGRIQRRTKNLRESSAEKPEERNACRALPTAAQPCKIGGGPAVLPPSPLRHISRPVSRVLYGPPVETCERDGHSSGTPVARRVKQPTRMTGPDRPEAFAPRHSYSVLLPVGFAVPLPLPASAVRSYRTVSPLPRAKRDAAHGGLISVALSLKPRPAKGSTPPDVIRHRLSVEPGLSSPAAFRHWRGAAVRPTDKG
jgi:hypothetical protein